MKRPYFKFYVGDFKSSDNVQELDTTQKGALLLMLMYASQTKDITLPDDDVKLAKICGVSLKKFQQMKPGLIKCFVVKRKKWHNLKLQKVLEDYDRTVENNTKASGIAAKKRSKKISSNGDQTVTQPEPITKTNNHLKKSLKKDFLNGGLTNQKNEKNSADFDNTTIPVPAGPFYQPDNTPAPKENLNQLIDGLLNSQAILELICAQIACNPAQANQLRQLFVAQLKATGMPGGITHVQLRNHCIHWCRSHAHKLSINN